ncbi:unnamed protein product [Eruca vesicaria subsp. sativa]|uniref:ATP synthase F0 subunit 8 n=1 Tax=Eruca vesicaria subsp. sativa TaxID=29727 RepID=A0ABC8J0D9_ERUVS|nr:unnamed protein product [Eruca vesicaria subsp. sativa]
MKFSSHIKMIMEYFDTPTKVIFLVIALVIVFFWMRSGPTMKAPGGNGRRISRDSFQKNPKGYFRDLRKK